MTWPERDNGVQNSQRGENAAGFVGKLSLRVTASSG
jgi:hypothetical protein